MSAAMNEVEVAFTVNGAAKTVRCEPRKLLSDVLRENLRLTGTHVGCEHGACGACTIMVDGAAEGIASPDGTLNPVQQAMQDNHGLQCGFCTPGIVVSLQAYLTDNPGASDDELREALSGNICRCTGYDGIIKAARQAAGR